MTRGLTLLRACCWSVMVGVPALSTVLLMSPAAAVAVPPPGEQLVPATAKFFVTCRNLRDFNTAADATLLGQLLDDPLMAPFREDLRKQIDARSDDGEVALGIRLDDIRGVCDGQATLAIMPLPPAADGSAQTAVVAVLDVTGHGPQVTALQQKLAASMTKKNAASQPMRTPSGAAGTHYVVPPKDATQRQREVVEALQTVGDATVWVLSDKPAAAAMLSASLAAAGDPASLAQDATFVKLMKETTPPAGEPTPHVALFIEPLGLSEILRVYEYPPEKHNPDGLVVFRNAGFDALRGIGGQATLGVGPYGVLVRVAVEAPKPWEKSMNMLHFEAGPDFAPPAWVAADVAAHVGMYWDVLQAFDHFGPIFDGFLEDEGIWADVLKSLEEDIDGPQVKLRDHFFSLFSKRVTAIVDQKLGQAEQKSRYLLAFEINNAQLVGETLHKAFENDDTVNKSKLGDIDIYELTATEEVPPNAPNQDGVVNGQRQIASALVAVSGGNFYIASKLDILEKVLGPPPASALATTADFVAVTAELQKFLPAENPQLVASGFVRVNELIRNDYELFRNGQMPGSKTVVGRALDLLLADETKSGPREKRLDGSKLPPFAQIEKYFAPLGAIVRNTPDGWAGVALTHDKLPPKGVAAAPAPASK